MQQRQRGRDVAQVAASRAHFQRCELPEIGSLQELHRVVRALLVDAVLVDLDDARVAERREHVKFAFEQGRELRWRFGVQALQRDTLPRRAIQGGKHHAHAASSELAFDLEALRRIPHFWRCSGHQPTVKNDASCAERNRVRQSRC
jgi:hypothetical protein